MARDMSASGGYGITVLHEPPRPDDALFDLVAVHGLNGDSFQTWTHKETKVMWLRDLLPEELPDVRIMTYGYNSKFRNFAVAQDFWSLALKLVCELVDFRRSAKERDRPIVFVCHSLGGIVVKKALLIRCQDEEQRKVQEAAYGIIFLATPHQGSSVASSAKLFASIIKACAPAYSLKLNVGLLGSLRKNDRVLWEITGEFVKKVPKIQIISFFEMKMTSFGIFKKIVVDQRSAILNVPNEVPIGQFADHKEIARFSSVNDRNYRPVVTRLLKLKQDIHAKLTLLTNGDGDEKRALSPDTDPIFVVPFDRCVSFRGRDRLLERMEKYFDQPNPTGRLVYALTGLGGSGKTHSALQYALRNRFKYKSGVVYFNATSTMTLVADFHRIYELLDLGNASNKIDFLKQWFSKPKNNRWLMIFDGADDLQSVNLSKFFPHCSWGHIIVTSRDQATVGLVAPAGHAIEPLEEQDAIDVLFEKAAIDNPSTEDFKQACSIVKLLGYLPLAVEQAGAYMRRRGKTLRDYRRLFDDKQYEVLNVTPGISGYEKTVATVWELNFRQLEKDAVEASHLLMLFSFLEAGDIQEAMLRRGSLPKKDWGQDGEITGYSPEDAGLDPELIGLLRDEMRFDGAIEQLLAFSLVQRNNTRDDGRTFSLHPLVQHCVSQRVSPIVRQKWRKQAILLVSQAFPSDTYIDKEHFGHTGRAISPHISRIISEFDRLDLDFQKSPIIRHALVRLLLSASTFHQKDGRQECSDRIKSLLAHDTESHALRTYGATLESSVLRASGKTAEAYKVLEDHISSTALRGTNEEQPPVNEYMNSVQGSLLLAFVDNLMRDGELSRAKLELEEWRPLNSEAPSTMETMILQRFNLRLGRILRDQGHISEALSCFERVYNAFTPDDHLVSSGWQISVISNLGGLYCEAGRPEDAERILQEELNIFHANRWIDIPTARKLKIALGETLIRRGMFAEAEELLMHLSSILAALPDAGLIANTDHFRVQTGLARISHLQREWDNALVRWAVALKMVEDSGWTKGFNHGIVLYSMAQALAQLKGLDESREMFEKAEKSLKVEERKYWIAGLGSYWYDYVVTTPGEVGPNPIIVHSERAIAEGSNTPVDSSSLREALKEVEDRLPN